MQIRDRIKDFRRVKAAELRPNPRNWRLHPQAQQDALRGVLAEIGYASALLARELDDGSLELVDGHLRAETTPDALVPVLVLDLDEHEAAKLLAVFDPLSRMAETDAAALGNLLPDVDTSCAALRNMLAELSEPASLDLASTELDEPAEKEIPELFQVVIECRDEAEQQAMFERMTREGHTCRLLTL